MSGRKPLTLEELRQMEKPTPVWAEIKKKTIENWDGYWCICQRGHIITPGLVSMYAEKMEGVVFYADKPPRLDRSVWEPCEFCGYAEYPDKALHPKEGYLFYAGFSKQRGVDSFCEGETEEINFCPICGRPLTEAAWQMLERRLAGRENQ